MDLNMEEMLSSVGERVLNGGMEENEHTEEPAISVVPQVEEPTRESVLTTVLCEEGMEVLADLIRSGPTTKDTLEKSATLNEDGADAKSAAESHTLSVSNEFTEEQLYNELLFQTNHPLGNDISDANQSQIFEYLKNAFHIEDKKHEEKMKEAKIKDKPDVKLNLEIIEARDLKSSETSGTSCVYYMKNQPENKSESGVQCNKKTPVWNEKGSLPIVDKENDSLIIEVWKFAQEQESVSPANTAMKEKIETLKNKAKGIMNEVLNSKNEEKRCSGVAEVPIKDIPSGAMDAWIPLKKDQKKVKGEVHVLLSLGTSRDVQVGCKEHRKLVRVMVRHELEKKPNAVFYWDGKLCETAEQILAQHRAHASLNELQVLLARWAGFCDQLEETPYNFLVLEELLQKFTTLQAKEEKLLENHEAKMFWEANKNLLPPCLKFIRYLFKMKNNFGDAMDQQLGTMLRILAILIEIKPPEDIDIFPSSRYTWLKTHHGMNNKLKRKVLDGIVHSAREWIDEKFAQIEYVPGEDDENNKKKCWALISKCKDVAATRRKMNASNVPEMKKDLLNSKALLACYNKEIPELKACVLASSFHDEKFKCLDIHYSKVVLQVFDNKVNEAVRPLVLSICNNLKKYDPKDKELDPQDKSTDLVGLYFNLKAFSEFEDSYFLGDKVKCSDFHNWFARGVSQWLDITLLKAMNMIKKAVEVDELEPLEDVKFSSSAVDVLAIFVMLEKDLRALKWPDEKDEFPLMAKLVKSITACTKHYADQIRQKVVKVTDLPGDYEIQLCTAINNIEHILVEGLEPLMKKLNVEALFVTLTQIRSHIPECHKGLKVLSRVVDAAENADEKMMEIVKVVSEKILKVVRENQSLSPTRFMSPISPINIHLGVLKRQLSKHNYHRAVTFIWESIVELIKQIVDTTHKEDKPPGFYKNLKKSLDFFESAFSRESLAFKNGELLEATKTILETLSKNSIDPIHKFYLERLVAQGKVDDYDKQGQINVMLQFQETSLKFEILNVRNLRTRNRNGDCNPYVRIELIPKQNFPEANSKLKTKIQKRSLKSCATFNETFEIDMTDGADTIDNALVRFVVKDYNRFGHNTTIGEALIRFDKINRDYANKAFSDVPQIELHLIEQVEVPQDIVNIKKSKTCDTMTDVDTQATNESTGTIN
ncbi:protein unc-13 homolog 4B-like [Neocloeon triangulifer]|uniref:protein unc-13 homolog 4B-like n=1 Tax=Neocloeon triangulifer TaxID=2078957 RepID=UPI00286F7E6E|nr:protein unc-13 homolog 4B-like [Neocloeon triangulifer]